MLTERKSYEIPLPVKSEAMLLDVKNPHDLRVAARLMAEGEAIIMPICGVMGFVCDATQDRGCDQIFDLKDRDRKQQLITAGSQLTRSRLIDYHKLNSSWEGFDFAGIYDIPTFVIFPAQAGLPRIFIKPDLEDQQTDTVAVWWANYYSGIKRLESFLQEIRPDAFIGGSSCNRSHHESITKSDQAFREFGRGNDRVAAIVVDSAYDRGEGLINGSHTMLHVSGDKIKPFRPGSVHTDSFRTILGERLEVPADFEDLPSAALLDVAQIRKNRHYLRPETFSQRIFRLFRVTA